jgi:phosphoglycolate phosphatase
MGVYEKPVCVKIFFDLDGTLIDSKKRLYELFQKLVSSSVFSYDEYWALKKNKINHKEILSSTFGYGEEEYAAFEKEWMEKIEMPEWLDLDIPFEGVSDYLNKLKEEHQLYVVTARQSEALALSQLSKFGWGNVFIKVFVTAQKKEKFDLIREAVNPDSSDWLVGDTGKDIQTGKQLGVQTAAVLSGFLSKEKLEEYGPDIIVESITDLNFPQ